MEHFLTVQQAQSSKKSNHTLIFISFLLFFLFSFLVRGVTLNYHNSLSFNELLTPVVSDLAISLSAFSVLIILAQLGRLACAGLLIFWPIVNFASIESILALNKPLSISDLHYTTNGSFLENTLQALAYPTAYALILILFLSFTLTSKSLKSIKLYLSIPLLTAALITTYFSTHNATSWLQANPLALTVINYYNISTNQASSTQDNIQFSNTADNPLLKNEVASSPSKRNKKNVLLIVLEGIPGAYINSIQDYFDISRNNIMPNLSNIAQNSQVTPSFVTHSQQTIRGLYSMLCGDYSKQSAVTPKSLEYLQLDSENRRQCLPQLLANEGYTTAYLQAANLAFMSKDQFMPAIGFQEVDGKTWFKDQYIKFGWGPDDRAFLEQASTRVQQLEKQGNPWFLTLLTVGTHHPYAVTDEFSQDYSNRKEAAVAYLDQAIPTLMKQLKDMNVLDNTLVVFTSDESHGVKGQPYGNNWGLNIMTGPDIKPGIKTGLYGLSDTSLTILDYLGLGDKGAHLIGRSLLRDYPKNRELSFHSTMGFQYQSTGSVNGCNSSGNCFIFKSENKKLFSSHYKREVLTGDSNHKAYKSLRTTAQQLDRSLITHNDNIQNWSLINKKLFKKSSGRPSLSNGSYINIPKSSKVTITLSAQSQDSSNNNKNTISLKHQGFIGIGKYNKKVSFDNISLPVLSGNDKLSLEYSFYAKEGLTHFSPNLYANINNDLFVDSFTVRIEQTDTPTPFTVNHLSLESNGNTRLFQKNKDGSYGIIVNYTLGDNVDFSGAGTGSQMLNSGWSSPEKWGVWSNSKKSELSFSLQPDTELNNESTYQLNIKTIAYVNKEKNNLSGTISLNGKPLGPFQFLHPERKKTLVYSIPPGVLQKSNNAVTITFNQLKSPDNLGLSNDTRLLGLGLKSMLIEPDNVFYRITSLWQ